MSPRRSLVLRAPAKVNLLLRVFGRRADGYHDLATLFQAVDLADEVTLTRAPSGVHLGVEGADVGPPERNLAGRAATLFLAEVGSAAGVAIHLVKRIPPGAGLGGGSSDGAAVLRGMDALWGGTVSPGRLAELGAALGSDVPFFLGGSALALGTGRGEVLQALPPLPPAALVLVLPHVRVATGAAYAALARRRAERGEARGAADPAGAVRLPGSWDDVADLAHNDFQAMVAETHPEVARSLEALDAAGARPALLSGSGSACFGVFAGAAEAEAAARGLTQALGWPAHAVGTLAGLPAWRSGDGHGG